MIDPQLAQLLLAISVLALPVVFAITFHEAAHGFVAHRLGDDTAYRMGRVTLNPLRHIDPIGTTVIPLVLYFAVGLPFGYAKPVPVNFARLNHPRRDMVLVAAAGPATNILLALVSALLLHVLPIVPAIGEAWASSLLWVSISLNVLLAVFNMIPLPPLDGGRVAVGILPDVLAYPLARLERYGMPLLLGLMILPMLGQRLHMDLDVFRYVVRVPADYLQYAILTVAGLHI